MWNSFLKHFFIDAYVYLWINKFVKEKIIL